MRKPFRIIPKLYLQWVSAHEEGMTLELMACDESGEILKKMDDPVATILAHNDDSQWLELYLEEGSIRISISELEQAIDLAKSGVHCEKYFDDINDSFPENT